MKKKMTHGFTLVETLVAVSILVVVITATFGTVQRGLSLATFSKNQVIAFYLASEGVEQIRNMRDENGLKKQNWLKNIAELITDSCYFGKTCTIGLTGSGSLDYAISRCSGEFDSCPVLKQNVVTGFYGYTDSWTDTVFKREIQLKSINENEVSVTVRMSWTQGLINREFQIRENILNWH